MTTMDGKHGPGAGWLGRVAREPLAHFLLLGTAVFLLHRIVVGDPRSIVMGKGLRADLARQVQDQLGRAPTADELAAAVQSWKRDEALYLESLRLGVDRDDPLVRSFLIDRLRERLFREAPTPEPTQADLDRQLAEHRALYERPYLYEYEYVVVPRGEAAATTPGKAVERLNAGATPAALGLRPMAAKLGREAIADTLGKAVAEGIIALPVGSWRSFDDGARWIVARLIAREGGLPPAATLRERLRVDFQMARQQAAVERAVGAIVGQYRFEEVR